MNLHNNNIYDKRSACFWCTHDFDNPPIFIPKNEFKDSYQVYGCFCTPECGAAHLMNEKIDTSVKFERYQLMNNIYCKIYQKSDKSLRRAQGNNYFISQSPRYGMEALGMILIAGLAYYLTQQSDGIQTAIPLLGAFALGAQKLLPILQQVYSSWSNLRGGQAALRETLALLDQPVDVNLTQPNERLIEFNDSLSFSNASFRYEGESEYVLNNLNFSIKKGTNNITIGTIKNIIGEDKLYTLSSCKNMDELFNLSKYFISTYLYLLMKFSSFIIEYQQLATLS